MKKFPAIAVVEFSSIADGVFTTDAILKKAPIAMIKSGTVSGGRHLTIFGGTTGSVGESLTEALTVGAGSVLDHAFLPDVHVNVHDAVLGKRTACEQEAVAILETDTVAANVRAAEAALKGTEVMLVEIRLAEYEMSGKAISIYNGMLHEIEAAMTIAGDTLRGRSAFTRHRIIARPHDTLTSQLGSTTRFAEAKPAELDGEEAS
ncbi:MAG TPA: BMC domain-containing protein [Verrucomicrobiae bacterium]|nr:BMC domain-containing protein [Verrucomicrobiae bacterium]